MRNHSPLFTLSWTLFHIIDEASPFYGLTLAEIQDKNWEVVVTFNGLDQDMGQTIVAHSMYNSKMIVQARKFADMIRLEDNTRIIDFSKLHEIES